MTSPMQELLALHTTTLEQAEAEIADRVDLREVIPVSDSKPFTLSRPLSSEDVAIPRVIGLTALGRPGASGEIFSLGSYHVVVDGSALTDIDLRVWIAVIKIAADSQSTIIEMGLREFARSCGESYGGEQGRRLWQSLTRLRTVRVTVSHRSRLLFDGALLGAIWRHANGTVGVRVVPETMALLEGFGRLEAITWGALGAPGRKIGAWIVCQRGNAKLGRAKWANLLDWADRPTKEAQRDLRAIMVRIEELGLVETWALDRRGMLTIQRPT